MQYPPKYCIIFAAMLDHPKISNIIILFGNTHTSPCTNYHNSTGKYLILQLVNISQNFAYFHNKTYWRNPTDDKIKYILLDSSYYLKLMILLAIL